VGGRLDTIQYSGKNQPYLLIPYRPHKTGVAIPYRYKGRFK